MTQGSRRQFLSGAASTLVGASLFSATGSVLAQHVEPGERCLYISNLHTGETERCVFRTHEGYVPEGITLFSKLVRDHYQNEMGPVDLELLELMFQIQHASGTKKPIQLISGFRTQRTNDALRGASSGVARKSMHTLGKAADIRIEGMSTQELYSLARSFKAGGVGRYKRSGFVHVDTGRVRYW